MNQLTLDRIDTIISDLDDTLLNENGEISPFTLKVLHECTQKGIRVIPASGRAKASMQPIVAQLHTGLPYIACNGAQHVDTHHQLTQTLVFPVDVAKELCAFMQAQQCFVQVYDDRYVYYAQECDEALQYQQITGMKGIAVGDLLSYITFETPKLLAIHHPDVIMTLHALAEKTFEGRATFTISKPNYLEAEPLGASKGEAAMRLSKELGFDQKSTIAFGDSLNDVSLLQFAKYGVAMGNARDEVKKIATHICKPNTEDGMAHFVKDHILSQYT